MKNSYKTTEQRWLAFKESGMDKTNYARTYKVKHGVMERLMLWGMGYEVGKLQKSLQPSPSAPDCSWNRATPEEQEEMLRKLQESCL